MRKNHLKSKLWQIVLKPNTDLKQIFDIKYVAEWSVKWELMRKPSIVQCKRCQRLNHSASNCKLPYRCVKCTEKHEPGACPSDSSPKKTKPKCVNCEGEHIANNASKCPIFKKEMQIREERKQKKITKKSGNATNNTQAVVYPKPMKQTSYADTLKEKRTPALEQNNTDNNLTLLLIESQKSISNMLQAMLEKQNEILTAFLNKK